MSEQKTYAPLIRSKSKTFNDGGTVINLSCKSSELIEFIKANSSGDFINLVLQKRKTASAANEYSLALDTWKPKDGSTQGTARESAPTSKPATNKPKDDGSDIPF